jgi:hypothetical protein
MEHRQGFPKRIGALVQRHFHELQPERDRVVVQSVHEGLLLVLLPCPSVIGKTGVVNLVPSDIGAMAVGAAIPESQVTGLVTDLAAKASISALNAAVSGLQSGSQVQATLSASSPIKQRADYVATSAVSSLSGQQTVDGVLTPHGSIVLCTQQPSSVNNGLWVVQSGTWTRTADFANGSYFTKGTLVLVGSGVANANTFWQENSPSGTVDTNANNWLKVMTAGPPNVYTAGNGLTLSGQSFAVSPASGGGLAVSGAGLAVDTAVVVRKYAGFVPSGSTVATITHNLNTTDIGAVFLREVSSGNQVLACPTITGPNTLTIEFASPPATNQWRVVVNG